MSAFTINVSSEFSRTPGPRSPDEGDFSGEEFLQKLLKPRFEQALAANTSLLVVLDGTEGYATSFLEASFGGLARLHDPATVLKTVTVVSNDEPYLVEEIQTYIKDARNK